MIEIGERVLELGDIPDGSADARDRANEVADRGADVAAALPTLQRAVSIAELFEGAVERLGRAIESPARGRPRPPQVPGEAAEPAGERNVTSTDEP